MSKRKTKKWLGRIAAAGVAAALLISAGTLVINLYMTGFARDRILTREECGVMINGADCILVLGAGVWSDGRPTPMLEDRILEGVALYETGVSGRIIMSGDHGQAGYDEVNAMKRYAVERGVPPDAVFMDHAGFSTYESMYRAKEIFGARRIVVVTQQFHLSRAVYIAEKLGMEAYGVASDPRSYQTIRQSETREVFARVKDFFMVILRPKPTYLGEPVSLAGSGEVTDG